MTSAQSDPRQGLPIERESGSRRPTTMPSRDRRDDESLALYDLEFCVEWQVEGGGTLAAQR